MQVYTGEKSNKSNQCEYARMLIRHLKTYSAATAIPAIPAIPNSAFHPYSPAHVQHDAVDLPEYQIFCNKFERLDLGNQNDARFASVSFSQKHQNPHASFFPIKSHAFTCLVFLS